MTIFFTSDQHYNHANIIKYCNRPFANVDEMNTALMKNHNDVVKPQDTVYMLGDLAFGYDTLGIHNLLSRLNGKKIWILGNHDSPHIHIAQSAGCVTHYRMLELTSGPTGPWGPQGVTLSHFPMISWNRSFHGSFNLHGHTHGNLPFDPAIRRIDVGVDSWDYKPVAWEVIREKLLAVQPTRSEPASILTT